MKSYLLNREGKNSEGVRPVLNYPNRLDQMRYFECLKFVQGKTILDIACGVGWGAYLFSKAGAKFVYGVDISRSVIHEANLFYKDQNIQYIFFFLQPLYIYL